MNLIIDVGNTYAKLAVYSKNRLLVKKVELHIDVSKVANSLLDKYKSIDSGIISSVGRLSKVDVKLISKRIQLIELNHKTSLPFKNFYGTPKTLGVDRIALVSASVEQFPNNNVLIIDAGTCITYDFITAKNEYLGGAISPGIRIRYTSLNNLTANLPLLESKAPKSFIGTTTSESIHSGIINGVLNEIEGVINKYIENYEDLTVILTGGDTKFLSKRLKSSIFANSNFLLEGLNYLLEFNTK